MSGVREGLIHMLFNKEDAFFEFQEYQSVFRSSTKYMKKVKCPMTLALFSTPVDPLKR